MRQELAFLDHLTRLLSGGADLGYRPPAERGGAHLRLVEVPQASHRVLKVEA
jgi:hypothetical protein